MGPPSLQSVPPVPLRLGCPNDPKGESGSGDLVGERQGRGRRYRVRSSLVCFCNPEVKTSEGSLHFEINLFKQNERRTKGQKTGSSQVSLGTLPIPFHCVERRGCQRFCQIRST